MLLGLPTTMTVHVVSDVGVLWAIDDNDLAFHELDFEDFSTIRDAGDDTTPNSFPNGLDGNQEVIWHATFSTGYEISPVDFSTVNSGSIPAEANGSQALGGDTSRMWSCDGTGDTVFEFDVSDFSFIDEASPIGSNHTSNIGGKSDIVWLNSNETNLNYELDPDTLDDVRSNSDTNYHAAGGDNTYIVGTDGNNGVIADASDWSVIRSGATGIALFGNLGGTGLAA